MPIVPDLSSGTVQGPVYTTIPQLGQGNRAPAPGPVYEGVPELPFPRSLCHGIAGMIGKGWGRNPLSHLLSLAWLPAVAPAGVAKGVPFHTASNSGQAK